MVLQQGQNKAVITELLYISVLDVEAGPRHQIELLFIDNNELQSPRGGSVDGDAGIESSR